MSSTAKKINFQERIENMNKVDSYSMAQMFFKDVRDINDAIDLLENALTFLPESEHDRIKTARIELVDMVLDKIALTKAFVGLSTDTTKDVATKSTAKVELKAGPKVAPAKEAVPFKVEEPKKEEKTEVTPTGEKQLLSEIGKECKVHLKAGNPGQAIKLAHNTLGKGFYKPNKDKQKPRKWDTDQIIDWLKDLAKNIGIDFKIPIEVKEPTNLKQESSKESKVEETPVETTEVVKTETNSKLAATRAIMYHKKQIQARVIKPSENNEPLTKEEQALVAVIGAYNPSFIKEGKKSAQANRDRLIAFGVPMIGMDNEEAMLTMFAERIIELEANGSEDAIVAKDIIPMFFEGRGYTEAQYTKWLDECRKVGKAKLSDLEHFEILGVPGDFFKEGQSQISDEDLLTILEADTTVEEKQIALYDHLAGKTVTWEKEDYALFTDNHVDEFVLMLLEQFPDEEEENVTNYALENMMSLVSTACAEGIDEATFTKDHIDLITNEDGSFMNLVDQTGKNTITIENETDFDAWVHAAYTVEETLKNNEGKKTIETQKENKTITQEETVEVYERDLIANALSNNDDGTKKYNNVNEFLESDTVKRLLQGKCSIQGLNKDNTIKMAIYNPIKKASRKQFKNDLKKIYELAHATPVYTTPDTFDDDDKTVRIHAFTQLQSEGDKLVKTGSNRDDMIEWVTKNIVGRQLEDQPDEKQIYTDDSIVASLVDSMFGFAEITESTPELTEEQGQDAIDKLIKDPKSTVGTVVKAAKDIYMKMGYVNAGREKEEVEMKAKGLSEVHALVLNRAKEIAPDKWKEMKQAAQSDNVERHMYVKGSFSEKNPEDWETLKETVDSLDELQVACTLLKDEKEEWTDALDFAIEIITSNTIEESKDWNEKQIAEWFNKNILGDPLDNIEEENQEATVSETKKTVDTSTSEEPVDTSFPEEMNDIADAKNKVVFRASLEQHLQNVELTDELRNNMVKAIKYGNGIYTKTVNHMSIKELENMVTSAKDRVKKGKDQEALKKHKAEIKAKEAAEKAALLEEAKKTKEAEEAAKAKK